MSIKIYNGYQIKNDNMTVFELKELLDNISIEMKKTFKDLYIKEVSKLVSTCLDFRNAFDNSEDIIKEFFEFEYNYTISQKSKLGLCIYRLIEAHSHSNLTSNNKFDFNCELELFPFKNKILFLLHTEKNEYKDIFGYIDEEFIEHNSKLFPNISPYIYYNNSDAPSNLENEWPHREYYWEKAIHNTKSLSYQLVKTELLDINYNVLNENIKNCYDERISNLSYIATYNEFKNKIISIDVDRNNKIDFIKIEKAIRNIEKSNEFKEKLELKKQEFYKKIPKSYDIKNIDDIKI